MNNIQFKIEAVDSDSIQTATVIQITGPKTELLALIQAGADLVGGYVERIASPDGEVFYENPHPEWN